MDGARREPAARVSAYRPAFEPAAGKWLGFPFDAAAIHTIARLAATLGRTPRAYPQALVTDAPVRLVAPQSLNRIDAGGAACGDESRSGSAEN